MIDKNILALIADSLALTSKDTVLEIGPGLGFLTQELLKRGASVLAVEKDRAYAAHLGKIFKDQSFRVIEKDILEFDFVGAQLIAPLQLPVKVIGNIPYNITSPIVEWLIENRALVSEAVLTVQWEVAQRLAGKPGGKDWSSLSVFLQFYADVSLLKKIGRGSFYPPPKVDSAVVRLKFLKTPYFAVKDQEFLFSLVRKAFQKRRKTILNALEGEKTKKELEPSLLQCSIDPRRRPETITLAEWAQLADLLL